MKKSKSTGHSFVNGIHMEHSVRTTYHEVCTNCGYVYDEHNELEWAGAPISGTYTICPKCKKEWYDNSREVITKTEERISLAEKDFHKLTNNQLQIKIQDRFKKGTEAVQITKGVESL